MTDEEQAQLMQRLQREHDERPHPGLAGARLRLHLAIHAVVETQAMEGTPIETASTLERLVREGLDRHEAVHAVGAVASEEVLACLSDPSKRYDEGRYIARLEALTAKSWREASEE
jgi:hypothetical protein